jgi:hypothetical protein
VICIKDGQLSEPVHNPREEKNQLQVLTDENAELLNLGAKVVDIVKSVRADRETKEDILKLAR